MTGSELLAKIKDQHPQIETLLLTGYSDLDAAMAAINDGGIRQYIQKPWNNEQLLDIINNLLSSLQSVEQSVTRVQASELNLLLVDAAPSNLADWLGQQGFVYRLCADVPQAMTRIGSSYVPDLLLLATDLPEEELLPSLQLLQQLAPQMRTILLRNDCHDHLLIRLLNQGQIYRFYRKPAPPALILKALQSAAQRPKNLVPALSTTVWHEAEQPVLQRLKRFLVALKLPGIS